ncbi:MAG: histone-like protein [Candidatus Helarchaeota archaeon]
MDLNSKPNFATKTAIRRLMKNECNIQMISMSAILDLQQFLEKLAIEVTKEALLNAKDNNRKTILLEDIEKTNSILKNIEFKPLINKKYFSWSPLRTLMAIQGAKLVSRDAVTYLLDKLHSIAIDITNEAEKIKNMMNKRKIDQEHMRKAIGKIGSVCEKCGAFLRLQARFCDKCGAKRSPTCPACGRIQREDARFCDNCGKKLY